MSRQKVTGFTLLELMVIIAILAILITLALPSFQGTLRSNRVATASNELLASLSLARSEGIRSTRGGGVCASADGTTCGVDWNAGWLVWTDEDADGALDVGEPVVRYSQGKPRLTVVGPAASIAFDRRGRLRAAGGQSISLAPEGAGTPARCLRIVQIGATGRTGVQRNPCP